MAAFGLPAAADGSCPAPSAAVSLDDVVARVRTEGWRTIFVGERHGVGPVKRFAVDLANALAADGSDVALYVEGFRRGCAAGDEGCWSVARAFNREAFAALLAEARVPVHPLDPAERDRRVERMAEVLAGGRESVRVVLVGNTHVVHAADADAEWLVWGGLRYPQPGDLARAVGSDGSLTFALATSRDASTPYRIQRGGCGVDYQLTTADAADYWAGGDPPPAAGSARATAGGSTTAGAPR
jgi:hypothetical protein